MATEYIEKQAVIGEILGQPPEAHYPTWYAEQIKAIPPAAVRPVVRGRWIVHMSELFPADSTIECDQCHELQTAFISDSFCPNCGADMRGGDAE